MYKLLPDIYQKNIYSIDYIALKDAGIKIILFDLENTLCAYEDERPNVNQKALMDELKKIGIMPIIISNAKKKRIAPYKDGLALNAAFFSLKPLKFKYKKIMNLYKVKPNEIAAIGDQLFTDVLGANRLGITSILVNPVSEEDYFLTKINRFFENRVINHYERRGIFSRGEYYE